MSPWELHPKREMGPERRGDDHCFGQHSTVRHVVLCVGSCGPANTADPRRSQHGVNHAHHAYSSNQLLNPSHDHVPHLRARIGVRRRYYCADDGFGADRVARSRIVGIV
jgi:hypothetical protein